MVNVRKVVVLGEVCCVLNIDGVRGDVVWIVGCLGRDNDSGTLRLECVDGVSNVPAKAAA